ncbi:hypothetical protein M622_14680 [Thauera terpenica 58Eu]|uniref:Uncharacterized protein n=1 Tax=Thauera terpenica 58Eu TaxID=1348657 RepID=S9ZQE4_9RHOO|nr:hypothetical protein [Thauera terpenica]EPZ15747.1 hypothetical protein M622_14680 [Thauera terpenica 58Eu]
MISRFYCDAIYALQAPSTRAPSIGTVTRLGTNGLHHPSRTFIVTAKPCRIAVLTFIAMPAVSAVINCGAQLTNTQHKQKIMLLTFFLEIYTVIGTQQRPLR